MPRRNGDKVQVFVGNQESTGNRHPLQKRMLMGNILNAYTAVCTHKIGGFNGAALSNRVRRRTYSLKLSNAEGGQAGAASLRNDLLGYLSDSAGRSCRGALKGLRRLNRAPVRVESAVAHSIPKPPTVLSARTFWRRLWVRKCNQLKQGENNGNG